MIGVKMHCINNYNKMNVRIEVNSQLEENIHWALVLIAVLKSRHKLEYLVTFKSFACLVDQSTAVKC